MPNSCHPICLSFSCLLSPSIATLGKAARIRCNFVQQVEFTMSFRKILFCLVVGLLMVPGAAFAAEEPASTTTFFAQEEPFAEWVWPEAGLSFEYPASWEFTRQGQFSFILY